MSILVVYKHGVSTYRIYINIIELVWYKIMKSMKKRKKIGYSNVFLYIPIIAYLHTLFYRYTVIKKDKNIFKKSLKKVLT